MKRPIGSGNVVHIVISTLTLSIVVQILGALLFLVVSEAAERLFSYDYSLGIREFDGKLYIYYNNFVNNVTNFVAIHYIVSLSYFVIIILTSILAALIFGAAARRLEWIGRILFGPLAPIMIDPISPVIQCFVLTKICNSTDRLIYAGYAVEVALKDGSNIDHIVLENPEKFYFRMNKISPRTTFNKAIPVNGGGGYGGLLYVSGDEIENVHFDHFYL